MKPHLPSLLTLSLLLLTTPLFGQSKFKWSFKYIEDTEKFGYIEVSPSFNWKKTIPFISRTNEYWLPTLKSQWECKVGISQLNHISYIQEEMTLTCHYGGKHNFPFIISRLDCHHNVEKNILVHSGEDDQPLLPNYKETKVGLFGGEGNEDLNWVYSICYGK